MQLIELILKRPDVVSFPFGAKLFVAAFSFCLFSFLATGSIYAQGGSDILPFDTVFSAPTILDTYELHHEEWRVGVYLGVNINRYGADNMKGLPGVPSCCPGYNSGQGVGMTFGGLAEYPTNDWFSVGARIFLSTYNGALIDDEAETVDAGGFAETAIFQHRIDADIWSIGLEPIATFDLTDEFKLFAGLHGDLAIRKRFVQHERILSPDDITYEDGARERLVYSGEIPNQTSLQGSIVGGMRYDFDFGTDGQFVISPELSFWYGLSPVVSNESWKIHGLRFAVSGQFLRFKEPDEREILERERKTEPADTSAPVVLPIIEDKERGNPKSGAGG